jgi:hypothetical protein
MESQFEEPEAAAVDILRANISRPELSGQLNLAFKCVAYKGFTLRNEVVIYGVVEIT